MAVITPVGQQDAQEFGSHQTPQLKGMEAEWPPGVRIARLVDVQSDY